MEKIRTNDEWLRELRATGEVQAAAIADLRAYLLRTVLYSFGRSRSSLVQLTFAEIEQIAQDSAQDALLEILERLDDFRGDSKFTTWAYKFAVNMAMSATRRMSWKQVSLDDLLDNLDWPELPIPDEQPAVDPDRTMLETEVWSAIRDVIEHDLTERQRQILKAIVLDEVPMDELVRHLGTNRNAIYKTLHDARLKVKGQLKARGFDVREMLHLFEAGR